MSSGSKPVRRPPLALETLEGREVPATLSPITDFTTPNSKPLYVPLTVTNTTGTVQYTASSSNAQVQVQVVQGGTTIRMNVSGTDAQGAAFSGALTFRLFDTLAPTTVARIVELVETGFYDGLTFHRILDGFVAQGGDPDGNGTGGSGQTLDDEFNVLATFNSPGLLAMAKSGDDTGDSQFFITDIDVPPLSQPQNLNFNHTIFGQLVAGFDTFNKLIRTPVNNPNAGTPVNPVTITSAEVVSNDPNGVLRVTAPANFTGTSTITVTPSDGGTGSTGDSFAVSFVADARNDPPFLGPVSDLTTTVGTGKSFTLTSTDLENDDVTYSVTATSNGQAINVNPRINQTSGKVTVTPPAGFVGTIQLTVGVRDTGTTPADTQVVTLTVNGSFDLEAASDTGALNDDNVTSKADPQVLVIAPTGQTVSVSLNGTTLGTATETSTPGQYRIAVPAGRLRVGENALTGMAGSTALTSFTMTYAPSLRQAYVVPGAVATSQQVTFQYVASEAAFQNEFGFFKADDANGRIGTLNPGDAGYAAAALARRQVVFARGSAVGTSSTITANGGEFLVPYLVQNATSADLLATNPSNAATGGPVAFFGFAAANPDGLAHAAATEDRQGSRVVYSWEDLTGGGDGDYNDAVISARRGGDAAITAERVPGGVGRIVPLTATFQTPVKPPGNTDTPTRGEVGVIPVDDASGKIGALNPGDAGWAAAALARARALFGANATAGQTATLNRTGGEFLVYYFVPGGTAAGVAASNPNNNPSAGPVAFFSLAAANPDDAVHARVFGPEGVRRTAPTADGPNTIHFMGDLNGTRRDFDDVVFTVNYGG